MKKIKVAIVFGGQSNEHDVSIMSARNVLNALDSALYEPALIYISRVGEWYTSPVADDVLRGKSLNIAKKTAIEVDDYLDADIVFTLIHGKGGEDGVVQSQLQERGIPFVGCDSESSKICYDKSITKELLKKNKFPVVPYEVAGKVNIELIEERLGYPMFVKPAHEGSSVGVGKAHNRDELIQAIEHAREFDEPTLVEKAIDGREIECAVLGNNETGAEASALGELIIYDEFYDYDSKYSEESKTEMIVPADLSSGLTEEIRQMALDAYRVIGCDGMARVDFFLEGDKLYLNEVNTIPGFTSKSMYPMLWEASGVAYSELITRLIELGIERQN